MPEFDFSPITEGIYNVIETEEKVLTSLQEETITQKRNRQNRTIKQILGHWIDSASVSYTHLSTPFHIFPHLPNNIVFFNSAVNLYLILSAFLYILLVYPCLLYTSYNVPSYSFNVNRHIVC